MRTPQLILIDGATGAGKSSVLTFLRDEYSARVLVGSKLTTRPKRIGDNSWEFRFVERIPETLEKYSFVSVGNQYAIDHVELSEALSRSLTYAISCVDLNTMKKLKSELNTIIIYLFRSLSDAELLSLLKSRGGSEQLESSLRSIELASVCQDYADKIDVYDHVLLNVGSVSRLFEQMSKVLLSYGITRKALVED